MSCAACRAPDARPLYPHFCGRPLCWFCRRRSERYIRRRLGFVAEDRVLFVQWLAQYLNRMARLADEKYLSSLTHEERVAYYSSIYQG